MSRLQRRGYTTRVLRHSDLDPADFATLSADAAQWRGDGGDERGFSMALGRLGDPLDGQLRDGRRPTTPTAGCERSSASCRGDATGSRWT